MEMEIKYNFETLLCTQVAPFVANVQLNRPEKLNAMSDLFFNEIHECFKKLSEDESFRVIILSGSGRCFTAGLDLKDTGKISEIVSDSNLDVGRKAKKFYDLIRRYQLAFAALENCSKPIIACVHGYCIGGGTNLVCFADIRFSTQDAWFQIKEIDLGMAADVGALQLLPKIIGNQSLVRELALTGRKMHADEAFRCGFISKIFPDKDGMLKESIDLAKMIAQKSPVAVQGIKANLIYSRDHSVNESLEYQARWNMSMLQSDDLGQALIANLSKTIPEFSKL